MVPAKIATDFAVAILAGATFKIFVFLRWRVVQFMIPKVRLTKVRGLLYLTRKRINKNKNKVGAMER